MDKYFENARFFKNCHAGRGKQKQRKGAEDDEPEAIGDYDNMRIPQILDGTGVTLTY